MKFYEHSKGSDPMAGAWNCPLTSN